MNFKFYLLMKNEELRMKNLWFVPLILHSSFLILHLFNYNLEAFAIN